MGVYRLTGATHCYTLECNYNMGRKVNRLLHPHAPEGTDQHRSLSPQPPLRCLSPKYTPDAWRSVGKALYIAALDVSEANPCSRLGAPGRELQGGLGRLRSAAVAWLRTKERAAAKKAAKKAAAAARRHRHHRRHHRHVFKKHPRPVRWNRPRFKKRRARMATKPSWRSPGHSGAMAEIPPVGGYNDEWFQGQNRQLYLSLSPFIKNKYVNTTTSPFVKGGKTMNCMARFVKGSLRRGACSQRNPLIQKMRHQAAKVCGWNPDERRKGKGKQFRRGKGKGKRGVALG